MNRKQRIAAANQRTRQAAVKDNLLQTRAQPFQLWLIQNLLGLTEKGRTLFPGVWHSRNLEDIENLAEQLNELAENNIAPTITLSWQPPLPLDPDENTRQPFDAAE